MRKNKSLIHYITLPVSNFYIYGLIDPRNNQMKYIGLSTTGFQRMKDHWGSVHKNTRTKVKSWLKHLKNNNIIFDVVYLEYFDKDSELIDESEQFWIMYFRSIGCELLNHDSGGRNKYGKFKFEETRRIHRERVKEELNRPEVKAKLSELTKKQWTDPEMRAKMSKKTNINKEAQKKSQASNRKSRGIKFYDDLGNYYECAAEFAEKWNCHISGVHMVLAGKNHTVMGRKLIRVSKRKDGKEIIQKEFIGQKNKRKKVQDNFGNIFESIIAAAKFYKIKDQYIRDLLKGRTSYIKSNPSLRFSEII